MRENAKHIKFDNLAFVGLFIIFTTVCIFLHRDRVMNVITSDTQGYYMYLPALFVYDGIHHLPEKDFTGNLRNDKGELYTKFTCGISYFYAPFFLAAHLYCYLQHTDRSGFSAPYCYALMLCGVFWSFVGLFLLRRLLLRYFDNATTWITVLCILLGTNFYFYTVIAMGMSHIYNFLLFTAAVYVTDRFYKIPSVKKVAIFSILLGWIVLTRPTNIVLVIFLLLYRVVNSDDWRDRFIFFKKNMVTVLCGAPFFLVPIIPQLIYWKEMTGKWIFDSYHNEHFLYLKSPKIAAVLFDTQNGLFLYSPILLFIFLGLFFKRRDPRSSSIAVTIVFTIITYLFASWWAWWFGAAFGHRCYVDYLPVFAFPLAVTIEWLIQSKFKLVRISTFIAIVLCCYYNIALSWLFLSKGVWDGPAWRWNWHGWLSLVHQIL